MGRHSNLSRHITMPGEVAIGRVGRSDTERRRHNIAYESHICQALSTELGHTSIMLIMASQLVAVYLYPLVRVYAA